MRVKNMLLSAAVIGSFIVLSPAVAAAQHRGGGHAVARPQVVRSHSVRPIVGRGSFGMGAYRGFSYYSSLTWGFPRWWYPFGYAPYWYGPYWYGSYGYRGDDQGGSIKLDVKPKTTDVFVDGYYAGDAADFGGWFRSLNVAPGNHEITLWSLGYRTVTQQVYVQFEGQLKLNCQMVPLATGELQDPRPVPPPVAQTPPARRDLSAAPDQPTPPVRPARPRRSVPRSQPAEPQQPASRPTPSQPAPSGAVGETPDYAQLTIKAQPAGVQVFIDGEAWHSSPGADRLVVHLPVGVHHIEIRKDGFRTFKTDVEIRSGEPTTLNVSLSGQDAG
jgi:hypothetical protein